MRKLRVIKQTSITVEQANTCYQANEHNSTMPISVLKAMCSKRAYTASGLENKMSLYGWHFRSYAIIDNHGKLKDGWRAAHSEFGMIYWYVGEVDESLFCPVCHSLDPEYVKTDGKWCKACWKLERGVKE